MHTKINLDSKLCVGLAITFLLVPWQYLVSWCCAVMIHELGHWLVLRILKVPVLSLSLSMRGISMETGDLLPQEELICAAAGPMCSGLLMLTGKLWPIIAFCGAIQCVFNLIPIPPFDGGRILRQIVHLCFREREENIIRCVSFIVGIIALFGMLILVFKGELWGGIVMGMLLCRSNALKIPCKDASERVQ